MSPIFISHGSPMTALQPREAGAFMQRLGPAIDAAFGRPQAILAVSAHTLARAPVLLAAAAARGGVRLRRLRRRALHAALRRAGRAGAGHAGAGAAAAQRASRCTASTRAAWTMASGRRCATCGPQADVPVLPLAFVPSWSPRQLFDFGAALAPLAAPGRAGDGQRQHHPQPAARLRRRAARQADAPEIAESAAFRQWMQQRGQAARLGRACSTTARRPRMRWTCTPPTSTCCPGTWPPARAGATARRCACTTARPSAAWAWTAMPSGRPRDRAADAR